MESILGLHKIFYVFWGGTRGGERNWCSNFWGGTDEGINKPAKYKQIHLSGHALCLVHTLPCLTQWHFFSWVNKEWNHARRELLRERGSPRWLLERSWGLWGKWKVWVYGHEWGVWTNKGGATASGSHMSMCQSTWETGIQEPATGQAGYLCWSLLLGASGTELQKLLTPYLTLPKTIQNLSWKIATPFAIANRPMAKELLYCFLTVLALTLIVLLLCIPEKS